MSTLNINAQRLRRDLDALADIGFLGPGLGLDRRAFSPAFLEAQEWLMGRMRDAGMEPRLDAVRNIWARVGPPDGPAVITGSHLDSVPGGGALDGALGVVAGLECLRVLAENAAPLSRAVELVAFNDEEGRFGGMLGSGTVAGILNRDDIARARDDAGAGLEDLLVSSGCDLDDTESVRRAPESVSAFVELHIEQGPVLEAAGADIGVVEALTGLFKWRCTMEGQSSHSGTTPMTLRRDAFRGVCAFANVIPDILARRGSEATRATIGRVVLSPGAANVVPGRADFVFEVRDQSGKALEALAAAFDGALAEAAAAHALTVHHEVEETLTPTACDGEIQRVVQSAAQSLGAEVLRMPSGAAHDAQCMARLAPVGMIFVPSVNGLSHSPQESTEWRHIEMGANTLLRTLAELTDNPA